MALLRDQRSVRKVYRRPEEPAPDAQSDELRFMGSSGLLTVDARFENAQNCSLMALNSLKLSSNSHYYRFFAMRRLYGLLFGRNDRSSLPFKRCKTEIAARMPSF